MTRRSLLGSARLAGQPILSVQSDERLVDLARAGHESAFEAIVRRYRRPLKRHCAGILGDERAEDAVQRTFVRAYESMMGTDGRLNLRPWLYRIAHNSALNALRDGGPQHEQLSERYDGIERPDQVLERGQRMRDVFTAVQALPALQRDALLLRELGGRSYDEIAAELGVTGGSVRQALHRARMTLRAGASAVTPIWLLTRLPPSQGQPAADRVAEALAAAGGGGGVAAKLCATAMVTGAVVGGAATVPQDQPGRVPGDERPGNRVQLGAPGAAATGRVGQRPSALGATHLVYSQAGSSRDDAGRGEGAHGDHRGDDGEHRSERPQDHDGGRDQPGAQDPPPRSGHGDASEDHDRSGDDDSGDGSGEPDGTETDGPDADEEEGVDGPDSAEPASSDLDEPEPEGPEGAPQPEHADH